MSDKSSKIFWSIAIVVGIVFSTSCQQHKREIERLNTSKDSIVQVVGEREQVIVDYIASINEIQDKMDSIKTAQNLLNVQLSKSDVEWEQTSKDQIIDDLLLINNLIEENKKTIATLQNRLKNSNLKSTEIQKMLDNLSKQIEEKDSEIIVLNIQIEQMKIDISQLSEKVETLAEESRTKSLQIEKQIDEIHTAYYCFGTREELIANNVIERTGGILGMGRTNKLKKDFSHDYFIKVDTREFKEVLLMVKKAQLITVHPENSYRFSVSEKTFEYFYIEEADDFWKVSKYLVIMVEA